MRNRRRIAGIVEGQTGWPRRGRLAVVIRDRASRQIGAGRRLSARKMSSLALLPAVCVVIAAYPARAQDEYEPRWVTLKLTGGYVLFDTELEQQTLSSASGGPASTFQRIYFAPSLGLDAAGSIYHPDLFAFSVEAEPGYEYQKLSNVGAAGSYTQNTVLQNYHGSGLLFQTKPFATTFSGSEDHQVIEYDLFNTVVMDSNSYGVSTGYRDGPVPVSLSYGQSHQDATGLAQEMIVDQQTLDLHARNERQAQNFTDLIYRFGETDQTIDQNHSTFNEDNTYQLATLTDSERFGQDGRNSLNNSLLYNGLDSPDLSSKSFTAQSELSMDLTPRLRNIDDYTFTDYSDNMTEYQQHFGRAALRHQLYDSLSSGIDVHGGMYHSGSGSSTVDATTVGVLATLDYHKNLGPWGHFSLGNSAQYDSVDQTSSGGLGVVPNESHTLTIIPTPLTQPLEVSIVSVTDSTGTRVLQEGVDYSVNRGVDPWEIQLIPTSLIVKSGDTVLVTYEVQSNPSGTYSTFQDQLQARLDLFDRLLSIYGRLSVVNNYTNQPGFMLEDIFETEAGATFNWRGFHLGADYDKRDSSLYSYTTEALSEGYQSGVFSDCTLSVDLHQRWTDYPAQDQRATYYDFNGRFQWRPTPKFSCNVEGGLEQQRGRGLDEDLAGVRAHADWNVGKLTLNVGYDYNDDNFVGEIRERHFFYLRAKRRF
jgi:hypothetical protein